MVSAGKIHVDPEKMTKLDEWEAPLKSAKEVRQCMGFFSYYRAFVNNFAEVVTDSRLSDLVKFFTAKICNSFGRNRTRYDNPNSV